MSKSNTEVATQQTNEVAKNAPQPPAQIMKNYFTSENVKARFNEIMGKKSQGFIASLLQVVNGNKSLQTANPATVYQAAMMAATLDLPINQNLGFAYIIPYGNQAQFQIGWKGLVQLAMRTGQYLRMNVTEVWSNQFKSYNQLTEDLNADFGIDGAGEIVGYCAYFKMLNGFEKTVYWSIAKVKSHAAKYSQAYRGDRATPWKDADQFHEMGKKTVLKNTLSKWGILSIEIQRAVVADQAIIKDAETLDVEYTDNIIIDEKSDPIAGRISLMIGDAKTIEDLQAIEKDVPEELQDLFNVKMDGLK